MHHWIRKFQVYSKQTEFGIGPTSILSYGNNLTDLLPAMYRIETILTSQKPKEITSYDTIIIPFDKYVWFFMLGCIITQFLLLVLMQNLWSNVTGTRKPHDFLFEGFVMHQLLGHLLE